MGYCMEQRDSTFMIDASKFPDVVKAIQDLAGKETIKDNGSYGGHYSWVSSNFAQNKDIESLMDAWRWTVEFDTAGNVNSIQFRGEKLGDDMILFKAIAPFVEKDSFIEMDGEDGCMWRWTFNGTTCEEVYPTVKW